MKHDPVFPCEFCGDEVTLPASDLRVNGEELICYNCAEDRMSEEEWEKDHGQF